MEAESEGESNKSNNNNNGGGMDGMDGQSEAPKRPKRQMKTPFQLETLERTYSEEMYPSESTRMELSVKLGLTDRQLQMWFCHRRLKDKKEAAGASNVRAGGMVGKKKGMINASRDELMVNPPGSEHGSGSGSGSGSGTRSGSGSRSRSSPSDYGDDVNDIPMVSKRYFESPRSVMERRVIACVEGQLGEPIREDGPILGMEFDELPPGAFGSPIVTDEHQDRYGRAYDSKFERCDSQPVKVAMSGIHESVGPVDSSGAFGRVVSSFLYDSPVDGPTAKTSAIAQGNGQLSRDYGIQGQVLNVSVLPQLENQRRFSSSPRDEGIITHEEDLLRMERKRKNDEARVGKEVQANEKRIKKELEKQDLLRRKREEQLRKEMEKHDRERRKEEERMVREKQRQEERSLREEKREMERRERFLQKESLRAERRKQKEELRREKEAAKLKAATERATARRLAKEFMELMEDERLELMELAASSKALPSITSLDHDTLQNLESFRNELSAFPPKSVQLKQPFSIQPWIDSEDNVGNLLMVWRFCITFADVLGLWPFTLDEFVQALHDYDSRLLSELHIALLKLIIKDIEDIARAPPGGSGTNQYNAVNLDGGHPRVVEGAYLWGFDIHNWQKHLNVLSWPEILRQFALSAGFGPKLKKGAERACLIDNDEVKGCEDVVSTLRNGLAAENAVARMQEKGLSLQRRSRHRLTPGTVKFAAYHVLSLEGSKGLSVVDIADKIQKSGLRDLSTSKTPEASISVALSRDPILFERIAPSTYCVRPAFTKDPADAEVILSAAREKIQRYVNGFLAEENADDIQREDDSESDVGEDPEVDDLGTPLDMSKISDNCNEAITCSENRKDNLSDDVALNLPNELNSACIGTSNPEKESTAIDESRSGELWVQELTEGEYSDLCVEERLNALVALIGVANEGNTIRAVLEERMDAANTLKKQMLAEAQIDKRRTKEDGISRFQDSSFTAAIEENQSPLTVLGHKDAEASLGTAGKEESSVSPDNLQNHVNSKSAEKCLVVCDSSMNLTNLIQQNVYTTERSRLQLKSFINHRAEEMYVYRSLPLGQDRRRNRYWQFVASSSRHDPGSGRIIVETHDGCWRLIDSQEAFDALYAALDTRGTRESHLQIMLQKSEKSFKESVRNLGRPNGVKKEAAEMGCSPPSAVDSPSSVVVSNSETCEPSSSFRIELGKNEVERMNSLNRYRDLQKWVSKQCFNSSTLCAIAYGKRRSKPLLGICEFCLDFYAFEEDICPSCYGKLGNILEKLKFFDQLIQNEDETKFNTHNLFFSDSSCPPRIGLLKALLILLEVSVPVEALQSSWTEDRRKSWGLKLHRASSTEDLLQILTQFEGVVKREYLSLDFERTEDLLGIDFFGERAPGDSVPQLPWIPQTTAAVALRLFELDASISYTLTQMTDSHHEKEAKLGSTHAYMKSIQLSEPTQRSRRAVTKRGGRRPKKVPNVKSRYGKSSFKISQTLPKEEQKSRGRGPRTVRRRKTENTNLEADHFGNKGSNGATNPNTVLEWIDEDIREIPIADEDEDDMNGNSSDEVISNSDSDSDKNVDGNVDPIEYERGERMRLSLDEGYNGKSMDLMETSDEEADNDFEDYRNSEGDVEMNNGGFDRNEEDDEEEGSDSMVSGDEYSD